MESKFLHSISFYKAAPVFSAITLVSTIIALDTASIVGKALCGIAAVASLAAMVKSAKHER